MGRCGLPSIPVPRRHSRRPGTVVQGSDARRKDSGQQDRRVDGRKSRGHAPGVGRIDPGSSITPIRVKACRCLCPTECSAAMSTPSTAGGRPPEARVPDYRTRMARVGADARPAGRAVASAPPGPAGRERDDRVAVTSRTASGRGCVARHRPVHGRDVHRPTGYAGLDDTDFPPGALWEPARCGQRT